MRRKRGQNITLSSDLRGSDNLDWQRDPAEFGRLCDLVLELLIKRDGISRQAVFAMVNEKDFFKHIRTFAAQFGSRRTGLVGYVYLHVKFALLADALKPRKRPGPGENPLGDPRGASG